MPGNSNSNGRGNGRGNKPKKVKADEKKSIKNGFRVFGDELNRDKAWIDLNVSGTDKHGRIYVIHADANGTPEEWALNSDSLGEMYENDLIVSSDEIPMENHEMWSTLEEIGNIRKNTNINNFVDQKLEDSARSLFQALLEAGKDQ